MEVYVKIRKRRSKTLLAICDSELLGKTLREGDIVFEVRNEFYKGMKMSVEEVVDVMKQASIVNMIGKHVVKTAIEKGLVHPEAVLKISGIPHAQIIKL